MNNTKLETTGKLRQISILKEELKELYKLNMGEVLNYGNNGFCDFRALLKNYEKITGNITDALEICKNYQMDLSIKDVIECYSIISDQMEFLDKSDIYDEYGFNAFDVLSMNFPYISELVSKCLENYEEKSILISDSYSCIIADRINPKNIAVHCIPINKIGNEIVKFIKAEVAEFDGNKINIVQENEETDQCQLSFFEEQLVPTIEKYAVIVSENIQSTLNAENIIALSRNLCDDGKMIFVTDYLVPYNQKTNDEVISLNKVGIYVDAIIDLNYSQLCYVGNKRNRLYIFSKKKSSEVVLGKADLSQLGGFADLLYYGRSDTIEFVKVGDSESVCYQDYMLNQLLHKVEKKYNGKIMYLKETKADFRKCKNDNSNTLYFSLNEKNSCLHTFPDTEKLYQHLTSIRLDKDILMARIASDFYNSSLGKRIVREYCIEHFDINWPRKSNHILEVPIIVYDIKEQLEYVKIEDKKENIMKNIFDSLDGNFIELRNKCADNEEFFEKLDSLYGLETINNILSVGHNEAENEIMEIMHDFEKTCQVPSDSLINKLDIDVQEKVRKFLITSNIVYRFLASRYDCEKLDFSAALIPLTKSLELVMNVVYRKMNVYEDSQFDSKVLQNYINRNGSRKNEITLGPAIYLLKDGNNVRVNNRNSAMNWDRRYNISHFTAWNDNTLSISNLRRFNNIEVRIDSHSPHDSRNQKISVSFSDRDDSYNRMLLVKGLEYIKDHHRNIVAHKESVSKTVCDECREMLLQAEHLLWILLYIMND